MQNFEKFNLSSSLLSGLKDMGITVPTPIQAQAIPLAIAGKDCLASAQTGTGKTISYLVPLIMHLTSNKNAKALILLPTRELALQVHAAFNALVKNGEKFNSALIIGGEPVGKQIPQVKRNPRVVVGTPGRVNDLLNQRILRLDGTNFFVLDEMDRMLDMGFQEQIKKIYDQLPKQHIQTLMFSATNPPYVIKLAQQYLKNPERIKVGSTTAPIETIQQEAVHTQMAKKMPMLLEELDKREGSIVVFVKTKFGAENLAKKLQSLNHNALAIHGNLTQNKRQRVIQLFRTQKSRILVATDVVARGLDIDHIRHVINYDLPQRPEEYIHRIGRTGRAGKSGEAISFITPQEKQQWKAIRLLLDKGTAGAY